MLPRATYRLQLHREFTFRHASALIPYLARLGISHIYCSPYFRAQVGSTHGYDVVDHNAFNPEIGSRQDFEAFVAALRAHGMGHIAILSPTMWASAMTMPGGWICCDMGANRSTLHTLTLIGTPANS